MSDDIHSLFPNREVIVGGETVTLRPFFFGEMPVVIKLIYPIISAAGLSQMLRVVEKDGQMTVSLKIPENMVDILLDVILEGSEPVMALLSFALKKERAWFNTISVDEGVDLVTTWFEVNRDFFAQRVLPKIVKLLPKDGTTSSQSSLTTGTTDAASTATP